MRDALAADGYQTSAIDEAQQAYAAGKVRDREAREHELWRWLLTQKMGREFVHRVLFARLGMTRFIDTRSVETLYSDAALHNLAFELLSQFVMVHRELYLQSVSEETKRQDEEREELATMRARWAQQDEELSDAE